MWKNWIPFRRKQKDNDIPTNQVNGKENSEDNLRRHLQNQHEDAASTSTSLARGEKSEKSLFQSSDRNNVLQKYDATQAYTKRTGEPLLRESGRFKSTKTMLNTTLPSRQTMIQTEHSEHHGGGNNLSQSFTAVHGPLLSTPIMPKVRRAIETNAGLRSSGRTSLLSRGKPVGRSLSLNYGPSNPAKSRAGQVPWVRLKRRESLGLAEYISGAPQSPNTVKLAPPETLGLPAAPSFRSSPLIVTTEANRSRMLDTQTVVSALREKRKRFGDNQASESVSEEMTSWQTSPKRRRQDSSQSNASSVSIPPMPDTLPNLIVTPGTSSMIHIEHLSNQRPSTIPAVDVFSNHLKPGLGGEQRPHEPVMVHIQDHRKADLNNSRLAQKALQSSLSSSIRARNNLSLLERGGVDLKRIRNHSSGLHRRASDISSLERSLGEPQAKAPCLLSQTASLPVTSCVEQKLSSSCNNNTSTASPPSSTSPVSTVSAPTKRKIAEGVLLRKQSLSMNSPVHSLKTIPSNELMSTSDFEKDKQKEYQRRVLDLLQEEDKETVSTAPSVVQAPLVTTVSSGLSLSSALAVTTPSASSSVATSIAITASLDSLNKLVQSATSNTPAASVALSPISSAKSDNTTISSASVQLLTNASTPLSTTPQTTGIGQSASSAQALGTGFTFGLQSQNSLPVSTAPLSSSSSGFQVNFGSIVSSTPSATSSSTPLSVPATVPQSSTLGLPSNTQFNFGVPPSSSIAPLQSGGGLNFSANPTSVSPGASSQTNAAATLNTGIKVSSNSSTTTPPTIQFGFQATSANNVVTGNTLSDISKPSSTATQPGGFTFSGSQSLSASGGFQLGQTTTQSSAITTTSASQPGGFNFGVPQTQANASSAGGFNFSTQVTTPATQATQQIFGATNTSISNVSASLSPSNSTSGGFQFGTTSTMSLPTVSSVAGGFAFNVAKPQLNTSVNQIVAQSQPNAPVNQSVAPPQLNASANQTLSMFSSSVTKSSATGLDFSQNPISAQTSASVQPSFAFGANTSSISSQFGNVTNTSSSVNKNLFGAPQTSTITNNSAFGAVAGGSTSNSGVFSFGGMPNTTAAALSPFGAVATTATNPSPFGTSTSTAVNTGLFNFGANINKSTSAPTAVFGNSAASSPATNQPPFGSAQPSPFGTAAVSTKPPIFGAPAPTAPPAFPAASTPAVFGAASTNVFGTNAASTNAFGTNATSTNAFGTSATSPNAFGTSATSAGFGSSSGLTSAPAFGSTAPAANQPFTFGAQPSSSTNQPAAPAFGSATGTVFGGGTNVSSSTGPASSVFGNQSSIAGGNVFGGANQTTTASQPSVFGASATPSVFGTSQPAPPAFGSTPGQSVFGAANTASGSAFGVASTQQSTVSVFGSGTQNTASPFGSSGGFGTAAKPNVNPFGAPASTTQGVGFNFTGNQTGSGQNAASPFGASTTSTASSGFNFGQATQPAAAASPAGGFNFSVTPSKPAFAAPNPAGGFNFTPSNVATPSFNFNASPSTPNMFTPQTPGSMHRPRVAARRGQRRGRR